MSIITTTVGRTTLISSRAPIYDRVKAAQLCAQLRAIRCAMRHLTRGSEARDYLNGLVQRYRQDRSNALSCKESMHVQFAEQSISCTRKTLQERWLLVRADSRRALQQERAARRTEVASYWAGPWGTANYTPLRTRSNRFQDMLCGVHAQLTNAGLQGIAGTYLRAQQERVRRHLRDAKIPGADDTRRFVSVEIECVLPNGSRNPLYDALLERNLGKYVCVKADGSLRTNPGNDSGLCVEVVVTAPIGEIETAVNGTCAALAACEAYVNDTCGLHVHLDMRHFDHTLAYSNLVAGQTVLRKLITEARAKNTYCKPVRKRAWPHAYSSRSSRYKAVNAQAFYHHRTIEIRMFAGCITAEKILGYVKACYAMAYAKQAVKRAPSTMRGWQRANPEAVDRGLIMWAHHTAAALATTTTVAA